MPLKPGVYEPTVEGYQLDRVADDAPGFLTVYEGTAAAGGDRVTIRAFPIPQERRARRAFRRAARERVSNSHPGLAPGREVVERDDRLYVVIEAGSASTLTDRLERGSLAPDAMVHFLEHVAAALDSVEWVADGILSSTQILVDETPDGERGVLLDPPKAISLREAGWPWVHPNPRYSPPELGWGEHLGGRSVVYSLGCILFECLSGRPPFDGDWLTLMEAHSAGPIPRVDERRPELGSALASVLARAMAKEAGDRFASAGDLLGAVSAALATAGDAQDHASGAGKAAPAVSSTIVEHALEGEELHPDAGPDRAPPERAQRTKPRADPDRLHAPREKPAAPKSAPAPPRPDPKPPAAVEPVAGADPPVAPPASGDEAAARRRPSPPPELEKPAARSEAEKPAARSQAEKPAARSEAEKPAAPPKAEKPAAQSESEAAAAAAAKPAVESGVETTMPKRRRPRPAPQTSSAIPSPIRPREADDEVEPAAVTERPSPPPVVAEPEPVLKRAAEPPVASQSAQRGRTRTPRLALLLWALTAACALTGYLIGKADAPSAQTAEVASAGPLSLELPDDWRRRARSSAAPRLPLRGTVAASPRGSSVAGIVAGTTERTGRDFLPSGLTGRDGKVAEPVRLGRYEAYRHRGVRTTHSDREFTVYAIPTAGGAAVLACHATSAAPRGFMRACERVASTLMLRGLRAVPLTDLAADRRRFASIVSSLRKRRSADRRRLAATRRATSQARRARSLKATYATTRRSLAGLDPALQPPGRHAQVLAAVGRIERSYDQLAKAAGRRSRSAYDRARRSLRDGEAGLARLLSDASP